MGYTNSGDAAFSFDFVSSSVKVMRFLLCATGYVLLGMVLYSWFTGSESIIAAVIDGSFITTFMYGVALIVALGVGYGFLHASMRALYAKLAAMKLQELALSRRTKTLS